MVQSKKAYLETQNDSKLEQGVLQSHPHALTHPGRCTERLKADIITFQSPQPFPGRDTILQHWGTVLNTEALVLVLLLLLLT